MKQKLYEHLWAVVCYVLVAGILYYKMPPDADLLMMSVVLVFVVGVVQIAWTFLAIIGYGLIWFWNAIANYRKNRKAWDKE
jgi:hypothetical protein